VAKVVVTPAEFTLVFFDAGRITELAGDVADKVGLPADAELRIDVDEGEPLGRTTVSSLDPITITVEGGAFEDAKRPRHMSDTSVIDVLGRLLFRAKDRLDPGFGSAPADGDLDLQQHTAWETYCVGRCARAGMQPAKPRRLYHFRNRHGFTDVADAVFERLWSAEGLTWADIEAACAETAAARQPA
jgi:hypothetical protein